MVSGNYFAQRKPTNSRAASGGWLSRYSTQRFTGIPSKLPPRMTRLVFTSKNAVSLRNRFPPAIGFFREVEGEGCHSSARNCHTFAAMSNSSYLFAGYLPTGEVVPRPLPEKFARVPSTG